MIWSSVPALIRNQRGPVRGRGASPPSSAILESNAGKSSGDLLSRAHPPGCVVQVHCFPPFWRMPIGIGPTPVWKTGSPARGYSASLSPSAIYRARSQVRISACKTERLGAIPSGLSICYCRSMRFTFLYQPFVHKEGSTWHTPSISVEAPDVEAAYADFLTKIPEGAKLFTWWEESAPVAQPVEATDSKPGS